jgi:hypothetical protein
VLLKLAADNPFPVALFVAALVAFQYSHISPLVG